MAQPTPAFFRIEKASKERFAEIAVNTGVSQAALLDWIIANLEVDEHGRLEAWVDTHPHAEELPIEAA